MATRRIAAFAASAGILAAVAASIALPVSNAAGAQTHSSVIYVYGTPGLNGPNGTIIVAGAIGDYGRTTKADQNGQTKPDGAYSKLELQNGTVLIDVRALQNKIQVGSQHAYLDPVSCSLHGSVSAPSPIVSGTGAYTGIKGTIETRFTLAELAARTPQGACDTNAEPTDEFATIYGTGKVVLPSQR